MPACIFTDKYAQLNNVERLLVQLLFSYFGPSFHPRLEQNFLEDRKSVGCCWMDEPMDNSSHQPHLLGSSGAALPDHPVFSSKQENFSVRFQICAAEIEHIRVCVCVWLTESLLHFMPACSCGTILTLKTAGELAGHQPQPPQLSLRITRLLLLRTGALAHLYQR